MRILVIGVGGIGGTIAAKLTLAGFSVSVTARHRPAKDCIRMELNGEEMSVPVNWTTSWQPADFDVIILTVRPNQLASVLAGKNTEMCGATFVVCQNGLCEPVVRRYVGEKARVIGAVISWAATRLNGVVIPTTKGVTTLGSYQGVDLDETDPICEMFQVVDTVDVTENLRGVRWSKLALNLAASALCILNGGMLGRGFLRPSSVLFAVGLIEEVCAAAAAANVKMEMIQDTIDLHALFYPMDRSGFRKTFGVVLIAFFALRYFRLESSMWRAMKNGEPAGIEFLCVPVLEVLGASAAKRVAALQSVTNQIERGELRPGKAAIDRVNRLSASRLF